MRVRPSTASRRNRRPAAAARSPGSSADTGSLARTTWRMDDAVGPRELELNGADEPCSACRLEVPDQQRCGKCWSAGRVDQAESWTRRQFEAKCRVQIPIGRGRPAPRGVFGQLTRRLLVKQTSADVPARLRVEQPDGAALAALVSRCADSGSCGSRSCGSIMRLGGIVSGRLS